MEHTPVLLKEVLEAINVQPGCSYIDCTFGAGGYTKAILDAGASYVYAFDRDPEVAKFAIDMDLHSCYSGKFKLFNIQNSAMDTCVTDKVEGIVYDLGVSSMQIDNAYRGFSFLKDGPLDMRMNQGAGLTAAQLIATYSEEDLARVIYEYGDEKKSRSIARRICKTRESKSIKTTLELASIVAGAVGRTHDGINPATRTFQAIRIEVNNELQELKNSLAIASQQLKEGGVIAAVTFHSGEDQIVKSVFNKLCGKSSNKNRYLPLEEESTQKALFEFVHKGVIEPSLEEVRRNIRARSAKLRAVRKKEAGAR